ncbi:MAG: DUF4956 domain-containing protein [Eubacteriales bacterium]|nr:DUF4956 domain-containing protein [Eubacteriales bacterium]
MSELMEIFMGKSLGGTYILTGANLCTSLLFSIGMSGFVMIIYRLCHDTLTYNRKFNMTLLMLSCISTVLLALIQNNPLLSLGVLGSLSICRVRTNTKDPRDLGFIFWAVAVGISSAVGAFLTGAVSSGVLACVLLVLNKGIRKRNARMVIVRGENRQLDFVQALLENAAGSTVQSKNIFPDTFELVYELHVKELEEEHLISVISSHEGIHGVNVLAPETKVA